MIDIGPDLLELFEYVPWIQSFEPQCSTQQGWGPRGLSSSSRTARGQLEDPKSWPWPLTVLALAFKWSGLGLGLDTSAFNHRSVINVLNL